MALVATPILKFVDLCLRLMKCRNEILTILTTPTSASRPPQPGKLIRVHRVCLVLPPRADFSGTRAMCR